MLNDYALPIAALEYEAQRRRIVVAGAVTARLTYDTSAVRYWNCYVGELDRGLWGDVYEFEGECLRAMEEVTR